MKELGKDMVRKRAKGKGSGQKSPNKPVNIEILSVGRNFRELDQRRLNYLVRPSFGIKMPLTSHIRLTSSSFSPSASHPIKQRQAKPE